MQSFSYGNFMDRSRAVNRIQLPPELWRVSVIGKMAALIATAAFYHRGIHMLQILLKAVHSSVLFAWAQNDFFIELITLRPHPLPLPAPCEILPSPPPPPSCLFPPFLPSSLSSSFLGHLRNHSCKACIIYELS